MPAPIVEHHPAAAERGAAPRAPAWLLALVALLALLPYLTLPSHGLVYDAPATVLRNEAVQHGSLARLFTTDFWGQPLDAEHSTRSWRPLVSLSWALQVRLTGNSAAAFHAADMALHALATLLVVLLAGRLGLRPAAAGAAGALFAMHPLQTEAVAGVVGRADLMAAAGLLGALLLHLGAGASPRRAVREAAALALLATALLCKEYAVAFPFVLVGTDLALGRARGERPERNLFFWAAALAVLGVYLALRLRLTGALGGVPMLAATDHPLIGATWSVRAATAARLLALATRLVVLPLGLNHHYRVGTLDPVEDFGDPPALAGLAALLGWAALALWRIARRHDALPAVAWLLVFLPLLPALNLISLGGVLFAERYLYLPLAGPALLAAAALERLGAAPGARRTGAAAALAVVLFASGVLSARRVADWRSDETLARASLAAYPGGAEVWRDLGLAVGAEGRHAEALESFERSLALAPAAPQTLQAYATALFNVGRFAEAAEAWRRVAEALPADAAIAALHDRAVLQAAGELARQGRADEARAVVARAVERDAELPRRWHETAVALERAGRPDEAAAVLRAILLAREDHVPTLFNLGRVLLLAGHRDEAAEALRRGLALRDDPRARALLEQALAAPPRAD